MPLSDSTIRALNPREKPYKKADQRGLYIEVRPTGSKLWRWKYRYHDCEKRISLGRYPDVSLAAARRLQANARSLLEDGKDPSFERQRDRLIASVVAENTFGAIAREYIEINMIGRQRAETTIAKSRWLLEQLSPLWPLPVSEITPAEVLGALRRIEAKGKHETARRCHSFASRVLRYAVITARAERDPTWALRGALINPKVTPRAALTDPHSITKLLRSIDEYSGSVVTRIALQILPHLMCKPGQLRQAEWSEFDLDCAKWAVPQHGRRLLVPYIVPLSRQVLALLRDLRELTGPTGFAFPAFHKPRRPLSEGTINQAFRRMEYTSEEVTAYGWRTTATTILERSGKWSSGAIERSLARPTAKPFRGTCNRALYWEERIEMHRWWSDYLEKLRSGGEVIAFPRRTGI